MRAGLNVSRTGVLVFLVASILAGVVPLLEGAASPDGDRAAFPGWPVFFESRPLMQLPLSSGELRFEREFAGRIARFSDGQREIAVRWVTAATRSLHPASDCLKAVGYDVHPEPIAIDSAGMRWGALTAIRSGQSLRVRERIYDDAGRSWTDASAWYWDALIGNSTGPWWAVTIAETAPIHEPDF